VRAKTDRNKIFLLQAQFMGSMEHKQQHNHMMHDVDEATDEHGMAMPSLSLPVMLLWIVGTWLLLIGVVWLSAHWVPVSFS